MPDVLRIEIEDENTVEDQVWVHQLPLETSKVEIMKAVECLYPTASSVYIFAAEEEDS